VIVICILLHTCTTQAFQKKIEKVCRRLPFRKPVSCLSSFWEQRLWSLPHTSVFLKLHTGSGIAFNVRNIHSRAMYVVPIEIDLGYDYNHTKYSKSPNINKSGIRNKATMFKEILHVSQCQISIRMI